jgi:hypothetical protein
LPAIREAERIAIDSHPPLRQIASAASTDTLVNTINTVGVMGKRIALGVP